MTDSDLDTRLLNQIQQAVPLVRAPFRELADSLGCDEQAVLERLRDLRGRDGIIREISGIFDAAALGYRQALVAMAAPPGHQDAAGSKVAEHPGVSHCYLRQLRGRPDTPPYNLWLTLAVSPESSLGLEETAGRLARLAGATSHAVLPALRRYKLSVRFDAGSSGLLATTEPAGHTATATELTDRHKRAVRALQQDLPLEGEPFDALAAAEGLGTGELLQIARELLESGGMRRYAAVLRHRAAGAKANVMVAWRVAESAADTAGGRAAASDRVSHCLLRKTADDWPYNLYTMIHGRDEQDCRMTIDELAAITELSDRVELWTVAEYAKRRVRLFTDDEQNWERGNI